MSTTEKAHVMRQVGTGKANVSEPLLKCRKRSDGNRNRGPVVAPGRAGGYLFTALAVARHGGGASSVWALARNVGTPRRDGAGWRVDAGGGRENPKQLKL
jgi:hypothetical protein